MMCEVPATVNVYRTECSLPDSDSHFFQTLLRAVCLMSVSLRKIISKFRILMKNSTLDLGRIGLSVK